MTIYNPLPRIESNHRNLTIRGQKLPTLVKPQDPAQSSMNDISIAGPNTIAASASISHASTEMQLHSTHILLVTSTAESLQLAGMVSSIDLMGEKPIILAQKRKLNREDITVSMVMHNLDQILILDKHIVDKSKIGNIIATLETHEADFALVTQPGHGDQLTVCGFFDTAQIRIQLHQRQR